MSEIEWWYVTPESMIRDIENHVRRSRENKYAFQVGLKDLEFDVNMEQFEAYGMDIPFKTIRQVEQALCSSLITPKIFVEEDDTRHQVLAFDHRPVGYSGFMGCVTHSLALTDQGLFEVGRYPAVSLSSECRYWQWFLHRRFASTEELSSIFEKQDLSPTQIVDRVYQAFMLE
jgi:hypothetical protein